MEHLQQSNSDSINMQHDYVDEADDTQCNNEDYDIFTIHEEFDDFYIDDCEKSEISTSDEDGNSSRILSTEILAPKKAKIDLECISVHSDSSSDRLNVDAMMSDEVEHDSNGETRYMLSKFLKLIFFFFSFTFIVLSNYPMSSYSY